MTRRTERVGDVLRAEIATIINRKVSDPRVRMTQSRPPPRTGSRIRGGR